MGDFEDKSKNHFASVFGHISHFKNFKRLTAQDILYQFMPGRFLALWEHRGSMLFGALGA